MFLDWEKHDIREGFTIGNIEKAIELIEFHVSREYVGTEEQAENEKYTDDWKTMDGEIVEGHSVASFIEQEGYFMIPMDDTGVAFDYGDTSSGGVMLPCVPYGESKEEFKSRLLEILEEMEKILK